MAESRNSTGDQHQPHGRRDRDSAFDRPQKRDRQRSDGDSVEHTDVSATNAHETFRPDRDGTDGTGW
jgi:hypothetical protein